MSAQRQARRRSRSLITSSPQTPPPRGLPVRWRSRRTLQVDPLPGPEGLPPALVAVRARNGPVVSELSGLEIGVAKRCDSGALPPVVVVPLAFVDAEAGPLSRAPAGRAVDPGDDLPVVRAQQPLQAVRARLELIDLLRVAKVVLVVDRAAAAIGPELPEVAEGAAQHRVGLRGGVTTVFHA